MHVTHPIHLLKHIDDIANPISISDQSELVVRQQCYKLHHKFLTSRSKF